MITSPDKNEIEVTFLGTGEACDPTRRNTSILIESITRLILLDCGFSSAQAYMAAEQAAVLDTIWISHLHGDHFFGVPHLIVHFYMQKRVEELVIVSGARYDDTILSAVNLAYPGLTGKLRFPIKFKTIPPGATWDDGDFSWSTAAVNHTQDSYALKLWQTDHSLYYSGDGRSSAESVKLMRKCDLVIHEAWSMEPVKPSHSSIEECLKLACTIKPPMMALVHLNRATRDKLDTSPLPPMESPPETILLFPKDGDSLILS